MDESYFNPRSREGSDQNSPKGYEAPEIFQSTLPRRERRSVFYKILFTIGISIHAPAKGATMRIFYTCQNFCISIHAPAKGATKIGELVTEIINISIHAPAKGATYTITTILKRQAYFNPRSREGSDIQNHTGLLK